MSLQQSNKNQHNPESMYRFAPKEQIVNSITLASFKHISKLISADHCTGQRDAQQSLSRRNRSSCKIGKEKKHNSTSLHCF